MSQTANQKDTTTDNATTNDQDNTTTKDAPKPIKKLPIDVVNRIAAGEVIQRPANAVKELIENCIDAKATSINVIVKNGGLKSLQIQDNGHGIKKEDLDIVCERFTTSKLQVYEDLKSITTYGFRGEALASISHVAHVTITSMTADSPCAYKAVYSDGKLIAPRPGDSAAPKSCAGVKGTQILVDDLFYNVATRRKAIKNASEEHQHIVAVVTKYAIHNAGISFSCKKFGESTTDVHTQMHNTTEDNIRLLYGQAVARELIHVAIEDTTDLHFKLEGHITNANYNMKKMAFILFINHRLVESKPLKSALDSVYAKYLPKGTHPFVYLSLVIAPQNVDVNVHPTKQEVRFLHEDQIIEKIQKVIEDKLLDQNKSRRFHAQSFLPGAGSTPSIGQSSSSQKKSDGTPSKAPRPDQMVRTDSRNQDLTGFLSKTISNLNNKNNSTDTDKDDADDFASDKNIVIDTRYDDEDNPSDFIQNVDDDFVDDVPPNSTTSTTPTKSSSSSSSSSSFSTPKHKGNAIIGSSSSSSSSSSFSSSKNSANKNSNNNNTNNHDTDNNNNNATQKKRAGDDIEGHIQKKSRSRKHKACELTSVENMVAGFQKNAHDGLLDLFKNHIFIGCIDQALALIQYRTKLYLLNMVTLSKELVYQEVFHRFGDMDRIRLSAPIPIHDLILIALESPLAGWSEANGEKEAIATKLTADMVKRSEMLSMYISMDIDETGNLSSLPQVLDDYIPQLKFLPLFILWLCTDVDWEYEVECFEGIARQIADFYCVQPETAYSDELLPRSTYPSPMTPGDDTDPGGHSSEWVIQHIVFPHLRRNFCPPKGFSNDGTIIQIAQLENLYKIFERC